MKVSRIFRPAPHQHSILVVMAFVMAITGAMAANMSASLSAEEQLTAGSMADQQAWQRNRNTVKNELHSLGAQTLSIELDERKNNQLQRRARVYQFNYTTQQSRLILVDFDTQSIVAEKNIDSVHLPLNEQEIATARALVQQDTKIMATLSQEHESRGLEALTDLSSIDAKASIYEPNDKNHPCAKQRCALFSLFDDTLTVFAVEPLVNLQGLSVTTLQQSL